ncbi:MAG: helix-turn-helix domain-containing protein [Pseudomonadota bacterium]
MPDSAVFAIGAAFALVMVYLLLFIRSGIRSLAEKLFVLLLVGVLGFLFHPWAHGTAWAWVTAPVQTTVPGVFWLWSASLFDDHFELAPWQVVLVAITVVLPFIERMVPGGGLDWLLLDFPQLLEFVIVGLALLAVARHWRVDLDNARRRMRLLFCAFNGGSLLVLLVFRELLFPGAPWLDTVQYGILALMLLATIALFVQYVPDLLRPGAQALASEPDEAQPAPAAVVAAEPPDEETRRILATLEGLMGEERAYREMGLTIGQLANRVDAPEYRLRQVINRAMGYRNFNDFLNSYRIAEVVDRLEDSANSEPVLSIALDVGFRSLSSFNKVFKDTYQKTPTEYRKQFQVAVGAD